MESYRNTQLQWNVAEQPDREELQLLMDAMGISRIIASILHSRGIYTVEHAEKFFHPDWDGCYDPFLMLDMNKAVDRLCRAIVNKEKIFIYGDYDVDGITSVSLLYLFLSKMGLDISFYIPDRQQEGYGLSELGIQKASDIGTTLLITVDCGITGFEEVEMARQKGIDCIISDHHEPGSVMPKAVAILDPKRHDCTYPFSELAGVGVAFKLIQAVAQQLELDDEEWRMYVDLVALGSAADIVPLVDENRILVKKGLDRINRHERLGLNALIESSGLTGKTIGTGQVVFILAPRINAVGRLGNAERAVRLLINQSRQQARDIADILETENRNRKNIDEATFQEAMQLIETEFNADRDKAVVLAKEGWHSGVIGIVASRIAETVCRPTIMITMEEGIGKGSARSVASFDIFEAIKSCDEHLIGFGGHRYAAGLTISTAKIEAFKTAFRGVASQVIGETDLVQKLTIDAEISLPEITERLVSHLNLLAPFGPMNMRPVFLSRNLQVVGTPRVVGRNHLKFKVRQGGEVFDAIGFDLGDLIYRLTPGEDSLDMVYVIEKNYWGGQSRLQLRVKDLR